MQGNLYVSLDSSINVQKWFMIKAIQANVEVMDLIGIFNPSGTRQLGDHRGPENWPDECPEARQT